MSMTAPKVNVSRGGFGDASGPLERAARMNRLITLDMLKSWHMTLMSRTSWPSITALQTAELG